MSHTIQKCREPTCRAEIIFLRTANGALMPVDAVTVQADDATYNAAVHTSHYKTCRAPNRFSKGKR
jgi:hypothetical protein